MKYIALHRIANSDCSKTAVWFGTLRLRFKSVPCPGILWLILCWGNDISSSFEYLSFTCHKALEMHWRSWQSRRRRDRQRRGWPGSSCWCPSTSCRGTRWRSPTGWRRSPPRWSWGRSLSCTHKRDWSELGPCGRFGLSNCWWGGPWGAKLPTLVQAPSSSHITVAPRPRLVSLLKIVHSTTILSKVLASHQISPHWHFRPKSRSVLDWRSSGG